LIVPGNYLRLGNIVPHLHARVVPRYLDDAAPEQPLPWIPVEVSVDQYSKRYAQLREAGALLQD
jgi:diadenosine tetraphosphate (Ap4A) HIT family hydrolase